MWCLKARHWDTFYERGGGAFFDEMRKFMQREYDYTLIDSQNGFNDIADICTGAQ